MNPGSHRRTCTLNSNFPELTGSSLTPVVFGEKTGTVGHTENSSNASLPLIKVQTDWSRATRKCFAYLKATSDPRQSKLTSYFNLIDEVGELIKGNVEIKNVFQNVQQKNENDKVTSSCQFLNKLLLNAEKNATRFPHKRRHDEIIKKFSTALFIYSGPMAYEFLHRNLPTALPSLRTVQRIVRNEYHLLHEGEFRFDDLLAHLNSYKTPKIVSIGEDATRVICRIDYDSETDKLVGFVLPCSDEGIPIGNSFMAVSFDNIEKAFRDGTKAKYAFVYMAKPLVEGVPAFCLSCSGTDNRFNRDLVLKRWQYIYSECSKREIQVVSFGADGDSREMSAMSFSMQVGHLNKSKLPEGFLLNIPVLSIPSEWRSWFCVGKPTMIAYVQDVVHVAVKLKSKFMQPSHVLLMGGYVAGVHHLRILQDIYPKDQHGLREKDLNHKDKQNFDAVLHITSNSVLELLIRLPDAKGTMIFLQVLRCVIDSYLDKQIEVYTRLRKAWYAVFFMRYWRQWLLLNTNCTLSNNFITSNAYKCIEINAHSLITFVMTLRDKLPANKDCFYPWMLGSQTCEKAFRAVRSMSSTYSTILNFGMLGLLRRLHRMQLQFTLESEADATGILHPNAMRHKVKDGINHGDCASYCLPNNSQIVEAIEEGKKEAQDSIEKLGMAEALKQKKSYWEKPYMLGIDGYNEHKDHSENSDKSEDCNGDGGKDDDHATNVSNYDDDNEKDQALINQKFVIAVQEVTSQEDEHTVAQGIKELQSVGLLESDLSDKLMSLHRTVFKRVPGTQLPLYSAELKSGKPKRFSACVAVNHNGVDLYIHKTTLCWLLQEGERVSSDRLFRVRDKQPLSTCDKKFKPNSKSKYFKSACPEICTSIKVGDVCAFADNSSGWKLGKIIKFANYMEKRIGLRNYSSNTALVSTSGLGILCSWYKRSCSKFTAAPLLSQEQVFQSLTKYLCTITYGCVDMFQTDATCQSDSILQGNSQAIDFATAQQITLSNDALVYIDNVVLRKPQPKGACQQSVENERHNASANWLTIADFALKKKDRNEISNGKELTDMHVNAYQALIKIFFPKLHGLQNTLFQNTCPLGQNEAIQIIHVRNSHWATIRVSGSNVYLYDSSYTTVSSDTAKTIAQLIHSKESEIKIHVMNISKQAGTTDCALFAMANLTLLAMNEDPSKVVYDQEDLRTHLINSLEKRIISPFPVKKRRRPVSSVTRVDNCQIYCYCRLPNDGKPMSGCDCCNGWFHNQCIQNSGNQPPNPEEINWYCVNCTSS